MEYEYKQKIIYQSNYWYNDGLRKANMHDLSGAIVSLRRSLQYNRDNVAARNLLGLVYYGRGEVCEGLVEWIISKNFKAKDNIANYFIASIQSSESELENYNQVVKKFNQCLNYCQQDGEDLAIIQLKKIVVEQPNFLKAHQLLALLYLHTEQYARARQTLRTARKLDTTNEQTLLYMHELTQLRGKKLKDQTQKEETITYTLGNETIIQPVSARIKEAAGRNTILNILLGIIVGAAFVWFLIVPAVVTSKNHTTNRQLVEYSDQIAAKDAEISAQKSALAEYRSTNDESEETVQTAASTSDSYENLMLASSQYDSNQYNNSTIAESLLNVKRAALGAQGQARYDELVQSVFVPLCDELYSTAVSQIEVANYASAIDSLNQVVSMIEGYNDGAALLNLGVAYAKNGDTENATTRFNQVVETYPDTEIATAAKTALGGDSNVGAAAQ